MPCRAAAEQRNATGRPSISKARKVSPLEQVARMEPPSSRSARVTRGQMLRSKFARMMRCATATALPAGAALLGLLLWGALRSGPGEAPPPRPADPVHLPPATAELRIASILRDIGFLMIPEKIILKKESLTKQETMEIFRHPLYSSEMLQAMNMPQRDVPPAFAKSGRRNIAK